MAIAPAVDPAHAFPVAAAESESAMPTAEIVYAFDLARLNSAKSIARKRTRSRCSVGNGSAHTQGQCAAGERQFHETSHEQDLLIVRRAFDPPRIARSDQWTGMHRGVGGGTAFSVGVRGAFSAHLDEPPMNGGGNYTTRPTASIRRTTFPQTQKIGLKSSRVRDCAGAFRIRRGSCHCRRGGESRRAARWPASGACRAPD